MSLFGKVLAILNVLAALGFLLLAALDYGQRQRWSYAVYRHDLLIRGLPVDERARDEDSRRIADGLGEATVKELFANDPVKTQEEEVSRRYNDLRGQVDSAGDDPAKRQKLVAILVPAFTTGGEREAALNRILGPLTDAGVRNPQAAAPVADILANEFDAVFKAARDKELNEESRRAAVAQVLYATTEDPAYHQRLQNVVGLRAYNQAVNTQAAANQDMARRLSQLIAADRAAFEQQHKPFLDQLRYLDQLILDLTGELDRQQKLTASHQELLTARQQEVESVGQQIKDTAEAVAVSLAEQGRMEKGIFEQQRLNGSTREANADLRRKVQARELGQ